MSSKLNIVQKVLAILNLSEEGKVENFFMKQRKFLEKNIKNLNKNLETITDKYQESFAEVSEKLEDAKERLDEAYTSVKVENVSNHETANQFAETYWEGITKAEKNVVDLEKTQANLTELFERDASEIKEQLVKYQIRLDRIS